VSTGNIASTLHVSSIPISSPQFHVDNGYLLIRLKFDDKPLYWQAWDVEVFHLDSRKELTPGITKIVQSDHHQVSVMTTTKISEKSWAKTTITLSAALKGQQSYVEVHSEVEWQEDMKFLKVEFPVDIRNTEASYETQYGIIRRPTHYNTT
jgi:alpha-mannosidase